jgi:hypothetical protein
MIYDQGDDCVCTRFPSWRCHFWRSFDFWCCLCLVRCYKERITVAGLFFTVILLSFFWMRASVLPLGHCIVAKSEYIGIFAILIYSLDRKKNCYVRTYNALVEAIS